MKAATISANPITIAMKTERNDILSKPLAVNCQWNLENILPKESLNKNIIAFTSLDKHND